MWRATIKGVLARKVRLLLTGLAIVLGVSFVAGTYVLTDTLKGSFGTLFRQFATGSDLVVRTRAPFDGEGGRERMPGGVLDEVRAVAGVDAADGFLLGSAQFVAKDGRTAIQTGGAPTFGISWGGADEVGSAGVVSGRVPVRDGEVAMDAGTAARNGFVVGDTVKVLLTGEAEQFEIVGILKLGNRGDFGAVSFAAFDPATAQRVFGAPDLWDAVNVRVVDGTRPSEVRGALERALGPTFEVMSSEAFAAENREPVDEFLDVLNNALLGFAGVGLLVGGFIIFNTFTILVSQRTRELGLLRAMGASGSQVVGSVLAEAAVVGVVASALGLLAGIALARFLFWLLPELGFPVPSGPLVVIGRTYVSAIVVGIGIAMLAAVVPAVRASRVPPIAAIGDLRTTPGPRLSVMRAILGLFVACAGLTIGAYGIGGSLETSLAVAVTFVGGFVVFVGLVVLGPLVARPISSLIGHPLPRIMGVTGQLARGNAMRNPRRTSATAAALVVGLALVALVAIFADSLKLSVRSALREVRADFIVTADQFAGFSPEVARRIGEVDGVQSVVSFRFGDARIDGNAELVNGVSGTAIEDVVDLRFLAGGTAGLADRGILLSEREADGYDKRVGERLVVDLPRLGPTGLDVVGIYRTRRFSGAFPIDFVISQELFSAGFPAEQRDTLVYVKAEPGRAAAVGSALRAGLAEPFPNVRVKDPDEYLADRERTIDQFLNVFFALLLLSEVIAVLGIVNTLMLSVHERTREIGLLRTVGTTRRQVWAMVCGESVIIAVIGCVLGTGVGLLWGWGVVQALRGQFVDQFSVPPGQLGLFLVVSVLAGLVAALLPAWHASRLDVLEAIAEE